uniref:Uncharacterized protein n=1 Tax=Rhizophora mucronata TaxID=61149 RepID=A0A2P2QHS5_RHIMU
MKKINENFMKASQAFQYGIGKHTHRKTIQKT